MRFPVRTTLPVLNAMLDDNHMSGDQGVTLVVSHLSDANTLYMFKQVFGDILNQPGVTTVSMGELAGRVNFHANLLKGDPRARVLFVTIYEVGNCVLEQLIYNELADLRNELIPAGISLVIFCPLRKEVDALLENNPMIAGHWPMEVAARGYESVQRILQLADANLVISLGPAAGLRNPRRVSIAIGKLRGLQHAMKTMITVDIPADLTEPTFDGIPNLN